MRPALLPLYDFFQQLRSRGFELGMDSYRLLLQALGEAHWWNNPREDGKAKLFRLCKTLWYKPNQSLEVFERLFEQWYTSHRKAWLAELPAAAAPEPPAEDSEPEAPPPQQPPPVLDLPEEEPEPQAPALEEEAAPAGPAQVPRPGKADTFIYLKPVLESMASPEAQPFPLLAEADEASAPSGRQQFLFTGGYRPIDVRGLKLAWRYLRSERQRVPGHQLDVPATIHTYLNTGLFTPQYQPEAAYTARLMVLIDHGGSMAAFEGFARAVTEAAPLGCFKALPSVLYFRNVPSDKLFFSPAHTRHVRVKELAERFRSNPLEIMIISDAGAARGHEHEARVLLTQRALRNLRLFAHHLVWLNPMPRHRWWDTSAEHIAALDECQMFEARPHEFKRAIDRLRGKQLV